MNNNYILIHATSFDFKIDNKVVTSYQCVIVTPQGYKTYKLARHAFEQICNEKLFGKPVFPLFNEYQKVDRFETRN